MPAAPPLADVFSGRRVLVTGHTGFKGPWLCLWLERLGAEVTGLALDPATDPSLFETARLAERVTHRVGDIRDLACVEHVLGESGAEVVFHLAAQSVVRRSYDDPKATFDTNVGGTVNVLEAVRRGGRVRAIVNVTSDKCYENREWVWGYRENDPMGGHDPYSASKGCAELVASAYERSFFAREGATPVGLGSARAGNVIGGGDWTPDGMLHDCVRALAVGERIGIRSPRSVRPWQHVLEPLHGYLLLAARLLDEPGAFSGGWNFGPQAEGVRTVAEVADAIIAAWGSGGWTDLSAGEAGGPHEAGVLRLSCDKAMTLLGWRPLLDFRTRIRWAVDWYKAYYASPTRAAALCQAQISEYAARLG